MLLAIDSGNTNTVFAVCDGRSMRASWRSSTDTRRTADEYAVWLIQLMALEGLTRADIDGVIIANVVPQASFNLKNLSHRYFGCRPLVVGEAGVDLGIGVLLDRPEEVGADRLVNAVAVRGRYPLPAIVIDFGTATTFDVVDENGSYCGGAIAPGINLSVEALHMAAAKLPRVAVRKPDQVIGRATVPAMESGVFWGYVGLIEGLVARIAAEHLGPGSGRKMTVIGTGGLAPLFAGATGTIEHTDVDLTLLGLIDIFERNRARR